MARGALSGRLVGFDADGVRFLRGSSADFTHTATIGRQEVHTGATAVYADAFLAELGAASVVSVDASAYEGATYIHDLNEPLPDELKRRFTAVIDAGSLEHVFN